MGGYIGAPIATLAKAYTAIPAANAVSTHQDALVFVLAMAGLTSGTEEIAQFDEEPVVDPPKAQRNLMEFFVAAAPITHEEDGAGTGLERDQQIAAKIPPPLRNRRVVDAILTQDHDR